MIKRVDGRCFERKAFPGACGLEDFLDTIFRESVVRDGMGSLVVRRHNQLLVQEVEDKKFAAGSQTLDHTSSYRVRVIDMVECGTYGGHIEAVEVRPLQLWRAGFGRDAQVSLIGQHLGGRQTLDRRLELPTGKEWEAGLPTWFCAFALYTSTIFSERSMPTAWGVYGKRAFDVCEKAGNRTRVRELVEGECHKVT